jgi:hypothetical protein
VSIETIEQAEEVIENFQELRELACQVATILYPIENRGSQYTFDPEDISLEGDQLYANYTTYSCGYSEDASLFIPYEYLFDDDWIKEAEKKRLRANIEAVEKRIAKEKLETELQNARDYTKYIELKHRFEPTD